MCSLSISGELSSIYLSTTVAVKPGHVLIDDFECVWWLFVWEEIKDTDEGIRWGLLMKWYCRRWQNTVCRMFLCARGDCLVVFWDLVWGSTILTTVPVSLTTLFCCCIGLIICIYGVILFSWRHITYWWILKRFGLGWVRRMTCSSPRRTVRSHSLVCSENPFSIVGIGPIPVKEL